MALRILILGSGGREHALAWKLSKSDLVQHIFVSPGNGGTSQEPKTTNVSLSSANNFADLVQFALHQKVFSHYTLSMSTTADHTNSRSTWSFLVPNNPS